MVSAINKSKSSSTKSAPTRKPSVGRKMLSQLQKLGKALLFPIAMMPFAAIFLRVGAAIPGDTEFAKVVGSILNAMGNAVFSNLAWLFAVGVAFGLSKDNRGEAAITGFVVFLLMQGLLLSKQGDLVNHIYNGMDIGGKGTGGAFHNVFSSPTGIVDGVQQYSTGDYDKIIVNNVFMGITVGTVVAFIYNKFNGIELPSILGFFSGRRLVPVLSLMAGTIVGILWAVWFPWLGYVLFKFSDVLVSAKGNRWSNAGIMGVYGIINRLLIPFGLHHVPNTLFWFSSLGGTMQDAAGNTVAGDINIFLHGPALNNTAGTFQSGFFPIMMFGLPALAGAIWFNADGNVQKKRVAALFAGSSLVTFFTGITEPIEFSFLFMAPALFGFHALMTGLFGFITGLFGIQLGFGFSAGLIDYGLSIPKSMDIISANKSGIDAVLANPAWIWVIGAAAAATYFFGGSFLIRKFNMDTPGRGNNLLRELNVDVKTTSVANGSNKYTHDANIFIDAVGGKENIKSVGNCATRLRFVLKDNSLVNKDAIKNTKAIGQLKVSGGYQIVMGPTVEMYADEIAELLKKTN